MIASCPFGQKSHPMTHILLTFCLMLTTTLYDFNPSSNASDWRVVDDVVMGGRSNGSFKVDSDGHGVFSGYVSLENNGGFSSVRHRTEAVAIGDASVVHLRVKGDGNTYQFRLKARSSDYYSYVGKFKTSGEWETIAIKLNTMYPSFRGRTLDFANFDQETIEEMAFLIANKREESFTLLIDKIELR